MLLRKCVWATKNARSYSFLAVFWLLFCTDKKVTIKKKSNRLFLSDRYGDYVVFQMLTA